MTEQEALKQKGFLAQSKAILNMYLEKRRPDLVRTVNLLLQHATNIAVARERERLTVAIQFRVDSLKTSNLENDNMDWSVYNENRAVISALEDVLKLIKD